MGFTLKDYEGKITARAYTTIRKAAKDKDFRSSGNGRDRQVYYFLNKMGLKSYYEKGACMSSISYVWDDLPHPEYIVNRLLLGSEAEYSWSNDNPDVLNMYLDWLCSDSPWSKCVISKTHVDVRKYGLVLDCNYPYPYVTGACIAIRNTHEFSQVMLEVWNDLVEAGATGTEAYLISQFTWKKDGVYDPNGARGHTAVSYLGGLYKKDIHMCIAGAIPTRYANLKDMARSGENSESWGSGKMNGNNLIKTLNEKGKKESREDEWGHGYNTHSIELTDLIEGFREWLKL